MIVVDKKILELFESCKYSFKLEMLRQQKKLGENFNIGTHSADLEKAKTIKRVICRKIAERVNEDGNLNLEIPNPPIADSIENFSTAISTGELVDYSKILNLNTMNVVSLQESFAVEFSEYIAIRTYIDFIAIPERENCIVVGSFKTGRDKKPEDDLEGRINAYIIRKVFKERYGMDLPVCWRKYYIIDEEVTEYTYEALDMQFIEESVIDVLKQMQEFILDEELYGKYSLGDHCSVCANKYHCRKSLKFNPEDPAEALEQSFVFAEKAKELKSYAMKYSKLKGIDINSKAGSYGYRKCPTTTLKNREGKNITKKDLILFLAQNDLLTDEIILDLNAEVKVVSPEIIAAVEKVGGKCVHGGKNMFMAV